uniref:Uncharacterized protein n=1 Tax=Staphylothermus marinus TaxID=2280 RepID=A0A7C4HAT1_STAMA
MKIIDREAYSLSLIFIREAIYLSLRKAGIEKGFIAYLSNLFLPNITDNVFVYNMKWFVSGLLSGLLMSLWIPLIIEATRLIGVALIVIFIVAYMIMVMLISILLTTDLIHQVLASINELGLWRRIEYLPYSRETIEKAASYSVIIGGGLSLLLGMGLSIGLIIYTFTEYSLAIFMIPFGFATSTLLIYPIIIYLNSKFGGRLPPLISLVIHVLIVALILTAYLNTLTFSSITEIEDFLNTYRFIFPFSFIHIIVMKNLEPYSILFAFTYFTAGLLLSIIIPSKYGIKLLSPTSSSSKGFYLKRIFPRLLTIGFKDVLILLRDSTRQKQFYGQTVALSTPFIITMFNSVFLEIIHGLEFVRSLFIVSIYSFVSYISAVIVSPILLFIEADRNRILYSLPISMREVVLSKTIASTILYQPISIFIFIISSILISPIHGLSIYYTANAYWITACYLALNLYLSYIWGKLGAWSEFSLGILKRIGVMIVSLIPLGILILTVLSFYIFQPITAYIILLVFPVPLTIYVLTRLIID